MVLNREPGQTSGFVLVTIDMVMKACLFLFLARANFIDAFSVVDDTTVDSLILDSSLRPRVASIVTAPLPL
jgi:hypothetical protein